MSQNLRFETSFALRLFTLFHVFFETASARSSLGVSSVLVGHEMSYSCTKIGHTEALASYLCTKIRHPEVLASYLCTKIRHPEALASYLCTKIRHPEALASYLCTKIRHPEVLASYLCTKIRHPRVSLPDCESRMGGLGSDQNDVAKLRKKIDICKFFRKKRCYSSSPLKVPLQLEHMRKLNKVFWGVRYYRMR